MLKYVEHRERKLEPNTSKHKVDTFDAYVKLAEIFLESNNKNLNKANKIIEKLNTSKEKNSFFTVVDLTKQEMKLLK